MSIDEALMKDGYELAEGVSQDGRVTQLWVNEKTGRGIRIEWFPLANVKS